MRISDWSSDVCFRSRAADDAHHLAAAHVEVEMVVDHRGAELGAQAGDGEDFLALPDGAVAAAALHDPGTHAQIPITEKKIDSRASSTMTRKIASRSEEHTSELQSLMRTSYAGF